MVRATAILTKTAVTTTVKTHTRVTMVRRGIVTFVAEGFGSDPTDKKFIMEVFRGSTGGTPGAAPTYEAGVAPCINKLDSTEELPSALFTIADVFGNETSYVVGKLLQRPTLHTQHNRQTLTFVGIAGETFDCRLLQDTSGAGATHAQLTVYGQG